MYIILMFKNKNIKKGESVMTNNRNTVFDFTVNFRNSIYGVRINWNGRMERNEQGEFLGMGNPFITVTRTNSNLFNDSTVEAIDVTFELPIDLNYSWSNIPNYVREYLHQRHIEYLRSLSADQIRNLSERDLELLTQENQ